MKVLQVNSYDFGGAAKACIRLHEALLDQGIDSQLLLKQKTRDIRASTVCPPPTKPRQPWQQRLLAKLRRIGVEFWLVSPPPDKSPEEVRRAMLLAQRPHGLETCSFPDSSTDICQAEEYTTADIIHFHWVADFLDWKTFFAKNTKPIVWTLHDQNPFLGIEHYAERFIDVDENGLPVPRKYTELEIRENDYWLTYKKKCLHNVKNLYIVAPSQWLLNCSKNSRLFAQYPHYYIPYGFPTNIFKPLDQKFCREVLGLPLDKRVILFVADRVENTRKGFAFLKKALENFKNENICLCVIGSKMQPEKCKNLIALGKIFDERLMAVAYSAADVFVIPSLEDNLPNTMIEALLCGTPVIGFPTGGIKETIQDEINGYLCNEISVAALVYNLEKFMHNIDGFNRHAIAKEAQKKYSLEIQAKAYIALYNHILNCKV
ncbi:MAG: glycosyltransferase [Bacteroidia bacterium]|nr:glycosyltransferase [Bacteroidia bacterium]